jgi:hypothetical protein
MLAIKVALAPLGLAIAAASLVHAASETETPLFEPGSTGRFGVDAHITSALVDDRFRAEVANYQPSVQGQFPRLSDSLLDLARTSFASDPLEVSSLRTIALGGILHSDEQRARRVMRIVERISRRDSITNLWLAQDYLKVGDIEAMLSSFDHALRTSSRVRESAMKPVVQTLASPESHVPLGRLLARRPEWEVNFWRELVRDPVGYPHVTEFLEATEIPVDRIPEESRLVLYQSLKRAHLFDVLFGLASLDPANDADGAALAEGRLTAAHGANPLGWTMHSQGSFAAQVQERTGELQIDARSGSFGVAADRVVRGGGNYRLAITMVEPVPDSAQLRLTMSCADEGNREMASIRLAAGERMGEAEFSADQCDFASMELSFAVEPGRRDAFIRVASIALQET